ncbi:MAG: adenine phosphoribosyltransferase [Anaerolineae bacterium]|nr:adenine phosphoribosyltransferase [Anaerolineae bacterium]
MTPDTQEYYTVNLCGLTRRLPLFVVAPGVRIAILNILGDTELVQRCAQELAKRLPKNADTLLTPEVKSIPLAHALSVATGIPYVVARKIHKPYMINSLSEEVVSITTGKPQTLWLDGKDRDLVKDKRVILVDDVISTGSTLQAMRALVVKAGGQVVAEAAIFTEGDPARWAGIIALGHLPVFTDKK